MTNGFEMMRYYRKSGWKFVRHGKKHDLFCHKDYPDEVPIPRHSKELKPGLEKSLLKILRKAQKQGGKQK